MSRHSLALGTLLMTTCDLRPQRIALAYGGEPFGISVGGVDSFVLALLPSEEEWRSIVNDSVPIDSKTMR